MSLITSLLALVGLVVLRPLMANRSIAHIVVLLTLAVTYAVVKKKRAEQMAKLEESEDEIPDTLRPVSSPPSSEALRSDEDKKNR